jgi:hypothetical protein
LIKFDAHRPRKPVPELPLMTYFARVEPSITKSGTVEIKLDFLCKCPKLHSEILSDVQTYASHVKKIRCYTVGTLLGDKILTLAEQSIGMKLRADYPKQIYDIDALLGSCQISNTAVNDMLVSVKVLTKLEASFRKIQVTSVDALLDVMKTMTKYSQIDTSGGDPSIRHNIEGFQQFLVNRNQRKPYYEWSSRSLRIRFLAILLCRAIQNQLNPSSIVDNIARCNKAVEKIRSFSGETVVESRKKILDLAQEKIPFFKELRGKPLERVFWQVVTLENLKEIESELGSHS